MEPTKENTQLIISQLSLWKGCDGYLRVINTTQNSRSKSQLLMSFPIPIMIQMLNEVRQQYGESILNINQELSNCKHKKQYISSSIEKTLINNGSLITLYPWTY
uniref:Uncharacterized protein n=1 Tax=Pithovirus LCPAC202 TaxID=2506592 RepID=A0A481Z5R7_9VIRU|nr:MAG: hypothetical protein LCPAC202_00910 [Pithovirus LCPAC202]